MNPAQFSLFTVLLITASAVFAHATNDHAKTNSPTKKEQMDWGIAGDSGSVRRTIEVKMLDTMRFSPDNIKVTEGETVKFVVKNTGATLHEFVIGTKAKNDEHAALMMKFPSMEHDEPYMAHVAAGKRGEIIWTFNKAGEFDFACLIPGHYQAGMVGKITVDAATQKSKGLLSRNR
jgi:uncharacterized cupredoxin-like copper-binding protein